jgi:hypothetical protein
LTAGQSLCIDSPEARETYLLHARSGWIAPTQATKKALIFKIGD